MLRFAAWPGIVLRGRRRDLRAGGVPVGCRSSVRDIACVRVSG